MRVSCEYQGCIKTFASAHNLRRHVKTAHLRLRNYECNVCLSAFSSKQNLRIHMFKHRRDQALEVPEGAHVEGQVETIAKLTDMVNQSLDPDLRPYTKIVRIYPYSDPRGSSILPKVEIKK